MKKILAVGVGTAALALALGAGTASAEDGVVGQTYADARSALSQQGFTTVVATTVGDRKNRDACIVTSASKASALDGTGNSGGSEMRVNLNCYATYGTALWPGFSLASEEGREMHSADAAAKLQKEAQARAAQEQAAQEELALADAGQAAE